MAVSFKRVRGEYPRQFWILFLGQLISSSGGSLVWPFMTIYLRQKLEIPLTTVGSLLALSSGMGLLSQFALGPVVDRFGRKVAMIVGLANEVVVMVAFGLVGRLEAFALLIALSGLIDPAFRIGLNAMVADIIEPERRPEAYALLRMIANLGVAIGPAVGGFIATRSYLYSFIAAATSAALYLAIVIFSIRETKPERAASESAREVEGGYGKILRDYPFVAFCGAYSITTMAYAQMMVFLPVYIKEVYAIPESRYGFIMATNAAMVVLFQFAITRVTERYSSALVLAVGAFFTAMGVGSVALGSGFPAFLLSMVILTIGEMIIVPTSVAFVADLAPVTMRGRYMGIYGLTWGVGFGLGPVLGGALSDNLGSHYIWYGGLALGLLSMAAFLIINMRRRPLEKAVSSMGDGEGRGEWR